MTVSLIVNTAAGGRVDTLNSSKSARHSERAYTLQNFVLPLYCADPMIDEVIVVGEWHPGPGYTYIECPSVWMSCVDTLHQRQAGFEAATGDTLIFQHDDHWLQEPISISVDVFVPERWTRLRSAAGEPLNNGQPDYISGHCAIYTRKVLLECPWSAVPKIHTWDVAHTKQILEAGFQIVWSNVLRVYDIEKGSTPWR